MSRSFAPERRRCAHEVLDTQHQSLTGHTRTTACVGEGLRAGVSRLGRAARLSASTHLSTRLAPTCLQVALAMRERYPILRDIR